MKDIKIQNHLILIIGFPRTLVAILPEAAQTASTSWETPHGAHPSPYTLFIPTFCN
jgi:hypothetical protein